MKKSIKNQTIRNIALVLGTIVVVSLILASLNIDKKEKINLATFAERIEAGDVKSLVVQDNTIKVTMQDDSTATVEKEKNISVSDLLINYGVSSETLKNIPLTIEEPSGAAYWGGIFLQTFLPILLIFALMLFFFKQVQGQSNRAMSFGQSGARETSKKQKDRVTFKDVAGAKEAKHELEEVVQFLKQPDKFSKIGAKIPKGVLLMGSPGTGKTLLARAVAGEAQVQFFHMSGSEFVEMFVGVGASRVRDLFNKAKKSAPCIVFIDEIDAVGRQRGTGLGGSHDEREQTLNQILVEMDGFEPNSGVIVIAATNRPDVLDPALLRPGRFDRRVVLDMPDIRDREAILKNHAKNKLLSPDVNLRRIAERTPGFSGADLANLMNEAAILTVRRNKKEVSMTEIIESIEKVMLGPERRSHMMNDHERKVTAYHEAGHALVAHLSPHSDPVQKVSIVSRGRAAGYTIKLPTEDRSMRTSTEYKEDLAVMLGGFSAEKIIFGDLTTGASNDMQQATKLAKNMVTQWGMSDALGPRTYGEHEDMVFLGRDFHENKNYSESRAELIDKEIDQLMSDALKRAMELISENKPAMDRIAEHLLKEEIIERAEFSEIVGVPPTNPKSVYKPEPEDAPKQEKPSEEPASQNASAEKSEPSAE